MAWIEDHCIFARKGWGKSALGLYFMREHEGGVLWHDPNDDMRVPSWAVEAGPDDKPSVLKAALKKGAKVMFHAGARNMTEELVRAQVGVLTDICKDVEASIRWDESHIALKQGQAVPTVLDYARRSRHFAGDFGAYTTNPQSVDKGLMYVGAVLYIGDAPMVEPWLQHYGHNAEEIMAAVRSGGPHSFVKVDGGKVEGPFKLSPEQLDPTA